MARSEAGGRRIVCEACDLPFYADNDECPYCSAPTGDADATGGESAADETGFIFDNGVSADRERTTCPRCGLPHYEDAGTCPYCASAGVADGDPSDSETGGGASADEEPSAAEPAGGDSEPTPSEPAESDRSTGDGSGGLLDRLRRTLGL